MSYVVNFIAAHNRFVTMIVNIHARKQIRVYEAMRFRKELAAKRKAVCLWDNSDLMILNFLEQKIPNTHALCRVDIWKCEENNKMKYLQVHLEWICYLNIYYTFIYLFRGPAHAFSVNLEHFVNNTVNFLCLTLANGKFPSC